MPAYGAKLNGISHLVLTRAGLVGAVGAHRVEHPEDGGSNPS